MIDIELVLAEYERESASGNARLAAWIAKHPEHKEALTDYAMMTEVLERGVNPPPDDAEETRMLQMAASTARDVLAGAQTVPMTSLIARARELGISPQALADRIGIGLAL